MDTADPAAIEAAEEREMLARQQELQDWKWLMSHPHGRRIFWMILSKTNIYIDSVPDLGAINSQRVLVDAAMRKLGLWLMGEIQEAAPDEYLTMLGDLREEEMRKGA